VKTIKFTFVLLLSAILFSCDKNSGKTENTSDTVVKVEVNTPDTVSSLPVTEPALEFDKKFDNIARYISGIKQEEGSALASLDTSKSWQSFSTSFDSSWKMLDANRFSKMKVWAETELKEANKTTRNVFYPFSGPDVLNAFILFPNAETYTLLALEPAGDLPDPLSLTAKARAEYVGSIQLSLNDLFKKSYFITKNMLQHLQKNKANGTVPLMSVFLKRTGNTIVKIEYIGVDSTGNTFVRDDSSKTKGTKGVRIDFITPTSNKIRSVYYFKVDLADNPGLKYNKGFVRYLNKMDTVHTYLKSASYLLHYPEFSTVRNIIFDKSDVVLQDDSGIAFDYFDKKKWNIQLYGKYAKPVNDFPHIKEPNLELAYKSDSTVKPLPFTLGYHWGTKEVNMLRALRK
jgi:hypothetical protein